MVKAQRASRIVNATIAGIDVVTIPVSHYAELLESQRQLEGRKIDRRAFAKSRLSSIERDQEVASFITMRLGKLPVDQIQKQCRKQFGKGLVPSRSAIYRYWQKLRKEAASNRL